MNDAALVPNISGKGKVIARVVAVTTGGRAVVKVKVFMDSAVRLLEPDDEPWYWVGRFSRFPYILWWRFVPTKPLKHKLTDLCHE